MTERLPPLGSWAGRGACQTQGIPAWEFFLEKREGYATQRAKAACAVCPVATSCLAYALENTPQGYWAGTIERDRWRVRKTARDARATPLPVVGSGEPC